MRSKSPPYECSTPSWRASARPYEQTIDMNKVQRYNWADEGGFLKYEPSPGFATAAARQCLERVQPETTQDQDCTLTIPPFLITGRSKIFLN
eukprot:1146622-Amphidinium_carterae.1